MQQHNPDSGRPNGRPPPSGFLLDARGRLARIYKGPVSTDRLLEDVAAPVGGNLLPLPRLLHLSLHELPGLDLVQPDGGKREVQGDEHCDRPPEARTRDDAGELLFGREPQTDDAAEEAVEKSA